MLVSRIQLQSNSSNSVLIGAKLPLALLKSYLNSCSYSFCFSSHTYNNENTSVPLLFVPGGKCSIPDTMLSSFTKQIRGMSFSLPSWIFTVCVRNTSLIHSTNSLSLLLDHSPSHLTEGQLKSLTM